ncbi:ArsR/SmtB family transcription factor [Neobacillus sp. SCS-31]|uniref:ArsR/SmtB family transcription factor n=1 Tax=Neobacillus oceani TaxID=3115292 RepID=UPI003906B11E
MEKIIPLTDLSLASTFSDYESKFKALADQKRLHIMNLLCQQEKISVMELTEKIGMPQSKLSYHLKVLLDAGFILKEEQGTYSYYTINEKEINHILSPELCCLFRPTCC